MTDPKGDRSVGPSKQIDPDLFLHVVKKSDDGIVIRGAKAHQTGCINSHWLIFMPTQRLDPGEEDYAVSCAVPVDAPGLTYIYGRQACDTRIVDGGEIDAGNPVYSGQEALIVVEDVFVPWRYVFMCGEIEFVPILLERFTAYHRRSYVCKTGVGDVLIGAAALAADYNGVGDKNHIKEKLVEMAHLNETIYGTGIASSFLSYRTKAGNWQCDHMLANVCKHNVTRFPYEIARLAQDLAGGVVVTLPSEKDLRSPETGHLLRKFFSTKKNVDPEDRMRIIRLIENMTIGRNAVGYLVESLHGAGSPQAQRIVISRLLQIEEKKKLAKRLAKIRDRGEQTREVTAKAT